MAAPQPRAAPLLRCVLSDPAKVGEGYSAYISYKITTTLTGRVEGLDASSYTVLRRFSDFYWLRDELRRLHPSFLIPALPEKQAFNRMHADLVEGRARALQRWLDRLTAHEVLGTADPTLKFVSLSAEAMTSLRESAGGVSTTVTKAASAAGTGVVSLLKGAASTISGAVGGGSTAAARPAKSAEDLSFEEVETYLYGEGPLLVALYSTAAGHAATYREQAQHLLDYGAALRAFGASEGGPLGTSLSATGLAVWAASTAAYEQSVQEVELWVEALGDLVRGIKSVKFMLAERARASAALADSLGNVERLRASITALASNPSATAATEKAKQENELTAAQTAVTEARAAYDRIASNVIGEVERYRMDLRADFRGMFLDFVSIQVRANTKLAAAWEKALPEVTSAVALEGAATIPGVPAAMMVGAGGAGAAGAGDGGFAGFAGAGGDPTAPPAASKPAEETNVFAGAF